MRTAVTAYLMDGRGQAADGRRKATTALVVDEQPDAVEAEPHALDAEWSEDDDGEAAPTRQAHAPVRARTKSAAALDPYAAYMASLRDVERFDRDEEHRLAVEYTRTHDPQIARRLVTAN